MTLHEHVAPYCTKSLPWNGRASGTDRHIRARTGTTHGAALDRRRCIGFPPTAVDPAADATALLPTPTSNRDPGSTLAPERSLRIHRSPPPCERGGDGRSAGYRARWGPPGDGRGRRPEVDRHTTGRGASCQGGLTPTPTRSGSTPGSTRAARRPGSSSTTQLDSSLNPGIVSKFLGPSGPSKQPKTLRHFSAPGSPNTLLLTVPICGLLNEYSVLYSASTSRRSTAISRSQSVLGGQRPVG